MTRLKPNFSLKHWRQLKSKNLVFEGKLKDNQKFTDEEKKEVIKYLETHSVLKTVEHFGIRETLIRSWRKKKLKLDKKTSSKRPYTIDEKKEILEHLKKFGMRKTLANFTASENSVARWAKKENIEYPKIKYSEEFKKEVLAYAKTNTNVNTCKKFGVADKTLRNWKKKEETL